MAKGQRRVVSSFRDGKYTYRKELVWCGKNCRGCPHGPYWYAYWRKDGVEHCRYIGKNLRLIGQIKVPAPEKYGSEAEEKQKFLPFPQEFSTEKG